jgi:hypothetical protein
MKIVVPIPRPTFERAEASGGNLIAIYPRNLYVKNSSRSCYIDIEKKKKKTVMPKWPY